MKLSVLIPCRNEEAAVEKTVDAVVRRLDAAGIACEILAVNDGSSDGTEGVLQSLRARLPMFRYVNNPPPHGFGFAVRKGLEHVQGDAVAIVMADGSDDPEDLVRYARKLEEGYDCVFGSRFIPGGAVTGYPWHKLALNRMGNHLIQRLFGFAYNDTTNAFKCYRRTVIEGTSPLTSRGFELTVELPLKAILKGYSYAVIPVSWVSRKEGISKLNIHEMGSRYCEVIWSLFFKKSSR
ncbi:MAG: glycosyltransferase family 2 protein [Candidatus Omnitrophota bacterium]|nr:glycosyltransferase family 2 protein [Candidatus Omnitrophota bacterium]MDZ4241452.1 glycosyltransferase family 2 protein [Candidatus Omnitrophota bacterium]